MKTALKTSSLSIPSKLVKPLLLQLRKLAEHAYIRQIGRVKCDCENFWMMSCDYSNFVIVQYKDAFLKQTKIN